MLRWLRGEHRAEVAQRSPASYGRTATGGCWRGIYGEVPPWEGRRARLPGGADPEAARLMGHQEHEQIYLSLSRKELQGLCKQHGLPANRSNIDLARSLESLFRRTNSSLPPSEEVLDIRPSSEPKLKDQSNPSRETDIDFGREYVARKNSSKAGTYRRIACLKESVKRDSQTVNQLEIHSQVTNQTTDRALDRVVNIGSACFSTIGTTEDFGCSTSGPGISGLQNLHATDVQDIAAYPRLALQCHEICNRNISQKISELKKNHHGLQNSVATSSGMCSLPVTPCGAKKFGECFPGSGLTSPNAITNTAPPAFQFFVASEDGVNLFVDLCSTPSEWIRSLKDEVCISQESYYRSLTLRREIRCLGDVTKNSKTSSTEIIETDLQLKASGGSSGCINSSLSFISEFCNSVAQPTNNDTPRSSDLTCNRSPVELSGRLDEASQVVSSSCTAHADIKNFMLSDTLSCPRVVPNSDGNFFLLEKVNASPLNGSLSKSSCNLQVNLEADRLKMFDQMEHQTLEAGPFCSLHRGEGFLGHMSESASEKSSLSLSSERCEISRSLDTCSNENHSECCQLFPLSDSKKVELLEDADHNRPRSTAYQANSRQKLAFPLDNMELDGSQLTNHILHQHVCDNPGNPIPEIPTSTFNKELESCFSLKEKEDPECPNSAKLLGKTCKRSHISEREDFQNKRQHTNGENRNGGAMNLRSTKTYPKESNYDPLVLPRRSIRLMSK